MDYCPEVQRYRQEVELRRRTILDGIRRLPIAVLIWGSAPGANTLGSATRLKLRDDLILHGHIADFSEDLIDPTSDIGIQAQQLSHVEAYDITFSIPEGHGSVAEIHDFAKVPRIAHKIVTFLNRAHNGGYSNETLLELQSTVTCAVELYDQENLPGCIVTSALGRITRLQEIYYMLGRRV
jgi:hypothetical protein